MDEHLRRILSNFDETAETVLIDRFRAIIDYETSEHRRWKELEEMSAIGPHSWQKAYLGKQRPTSEMLEAVAQAWPQYVLWLMCGITRLETGQVCPPGAHPWPSARDELATPPLGDISLARLIKLKPYLKRYLGDDELPEGEEKMVGEILYNLNMALITNTVLTRLMVNQEVGTQSREND